MLQNEKISVVVPIYNVEEYLPRCLDSIIAQTYSNIEIMLVDDGSPDGAGVVCDQYATKDERIRVFHIPNGGVAKARQLGVESSTGEYIVFVDPDDWLPLNSIETLYNSMSDDVDIVIGGNYRCCNNRNKAKLPKQKIYSKREYLALMVGWEIEVAPWGKLYRRELFKEESFPNVKHTEDLLMNVEVANRVRSVKVTNHAVYNYFIRSASTTRSFKGMLDYERNFSQLLKNILVDNGVFEENITPYYKCVLCLLYRYIFKGNKLDTKEPMAVDTYNRLKNEKLSLTNTIKLYMIHNSCWQALVYNIRRMRG